MIKTKNDNNEIATKGFMREMIDGLAIHINKSFEGMESRMAKQKDLLALTERVVGLEKDMKGVRNDFTDVFGELKGIRERLDRIEKNDMSVDVINLDLRVKKLEKKAGLK